MAGLAHRGWRAAWQPGPRRMTRRGARRRGATACRAPARLASAAGMVHQSARLQPGQRWKSCHDRPCQGRAAAPGRATCFAIALLVRGWLYVVLLVLFALVLVGGATRLTDSGLSITEWQPIHGVIPPLNDAEWQEEFQHYQQIPQYAELNKGMSIEAFKSIFWWEWAHRILARSVGVVFALPLLFFWATRPHRARPWSRSCVGILLLGGLQGAIGWWMVASGLVDRIDVSQYRLATHLTLAA